LEIGVAILERAKGLVSIVGDIDIEANSRVVMMGFILYVYWYLLGSK